MPFFYQQPFANSGDKSAIPFPVQPDGSVSYNQGFGFDYSRDKATDPLAKDVPRQPFNQALFDVTDNLGWWQRHCAPEFVDDSDGLGNPLVYGKGALVRWRSTPLDPYRTYISTIDGNNYAPDNPDQWAVLPSGYAPNADTTSTDLIVTPSYVTNRLASFTVTVPAASTTVAGVSEYATDAETIAGTILDRTVTVTGLAAAASALGWVTPAASTTTAGKVELADNPETAAFTDTTRAVTPAGLGFAIPAASTTAVGRARLATAAEATAQSLGTVAVPPNALTGYARLNQNASFTLVQSSGGFDVTSSRKVKTALRENPYGLAAVLAIDTAAGFYHRDYVDDGRERVFLIAEQLATVVPQAVDPAGARYHGEAVPTVNYDMLVPVLIKALQEERALRVSGVRTATLIGMLGVAAAAFALTAAVFGS